MSTETDRDDQAEEPVEKPGKRARFGGTSRAAKVGWSLYQQIAAVIGAFGLLVVIRHFWNIGLKGFIAAVAGVWDATVRPAAEFVFHVLITVPLSWFGVNFEVPLWLRDYLSVGLVLAFSILRWSQQASRRASRLLHHMVETESRLRLMTALAIPLWPAVIVWLLARPIYEILWKGYRWTWHKKVRKPEGFEIDNLAIIARLVMVEGKQLEPDAAAWLRREVAPYLAYELDRARVRAVLWALAPLLYLSLLLLINQFL